MQQQKHGLFNQGGLKGLFVLIVALAREAEVMMVDGPTSKPITRRPASTRGRCIPIDRTTTLRGTDQQGTCGL